MKQILSILALVAIQSPAFAQNLGSQAGISWLNAHAANSSVFYGHEAGEPEQSCAVIVAYNAGDGDSRPGLHGFRSHSGAYVAVMESDSVNVNISQIGSLAVRRTGNFQQQSLITLNVSPSGAFQCAPTANCSKFTASHIFATDNSEGGEGDKGRIDIMLDGDRVVQALAHIGLSPDLIKLFGITKQDVTCIIDSK